MSATLPPTQGDTGVTQKPQFVGPRLALAKAGVSFPLITPCFCFGYNPYVFRLAIDGFVQSLLGFEASDDLCDGMAVICKAGSSSRWILMFLWNIRQGFWLHG